MDPVLRIIDCDLPGDPHHRMLRRHIARPFRQASQSKHRSCVDDLSSWLITTGIRRPRLLRVLTPEPHCTLIGRVGTVIIFS